MFRRDARERSHELLDVAQAVIIVDLQHGV
jgi:hypothetical protein